MENVSIVIDEKLDIRMTRDGAVDNMEVKGMLSLTINNPEFGRCALKLKRGDTSGYQFQNHPNINKPLFMSDAVLALKNTDREFPIGECCPLVGLCNFAMPFSGSSCGTGVANACLRLILLAVVVLCILLSTLLVELVLMTSLTAGSAIGILRWRGVYKEESKVPLTSASLACTFTQ